MSKMSCHNCIIRHLLFKFHLQNVEDATFQTAFVQKLYTFLKGNVLKMMTQFASFSSGAFVICWTPGLVVLLMDGLNCENCHVMKLKRWLLLLAVLNSVMNPCIYSYKDEEMWATFKNLMRCIGNGTRRQRSTNANSKPLSSGHDTGNSQPPSEEMKNDEGLLKNWKLFLFLFFFFENICPDLNDLYEKRLELTWKRSCICLQLVSVGCVCPQIKSSLLKRHFTPTPPLLELVRWR